jgi:hypothetical protein
MTSVELPDLTDIREGLSLRRQLRIEAAEWWRRHVTSICLLAPLLVLVGAVHAIGMWSFPRWVDDPGTYLSQAWSLQYQHALSPYSYIYDHAPAGWIQLSLWSMLTNGFNRHESAIGFGNECMLLAKLASSALLYALGRRLQFSRLGAAGAVLLFGLCPLELMYSRWTFLDNLVTPWLLLAFVLATSPRRSIAAATGAALSFALATLTKETALVALPALVWAMAQNLDRRNRPQVVAVAGFIRQRVRWMQGFIHVFFERDWLRLPTLSQRVLAVYVLGFQFFQAVSGLLAPVALALALFHKAPVLLTLLATVPLALSGLTVLLDVVLLAQFGRTFGERVRLRDYTGLVLGAYPFQVVLSVAAVWATARFAIGRNDWVKTRHQGVHLGATAAGSRQPALAEKAS